MNLAEYHIVGNGLWYHPLAHIDDIGYPSIFVCHLDTALTLHDLMLKVQQFERELEEKKENS